VRLPVSLGNQLAYHEPPDYVDLFLIHDPLSGTERRLQTYKALLEAKENGKIRSVGVSN
jgi:diketogulonate reductase-like aldo/keto reductase